MSEFTECLRTSYEKLIMFEHYQKTRIEVNLSILQQDGSVKAAVINAISLALVEAGIEIKDTMVAVQVGYDGQSPMADLTYHEEKDSEGVMTMSFLPHTEEIDFMEMAGGKVSLAVYDSMLSMGVEMCRELYKIMNQSLKEYAIKKLLFCQQ